MLENIAIIDATMIVGVLFTEAIGRAFGIRTSFGMGRWMLLWGLISLLPFSISAILALFGSEFSIISACFGFAGFSLWFLFTTFSIGLEKTPPQRIVTEAELQSYLNLRWCVVAVLESGNVVIELRF